MSNQATPVPCSHARPSATRGCVECSMFKLRSSYGRCLRDCPAYDGPPRETVAITQAGRTIRGQQPTTAAAPGPGSAPGVGDELHHLIMRLRDVVEWLAAVASWLRFRRLADRLDRIDLAERKCCSCTSMRHQMNRWGPAGCRANMDRITSHMRQQAEDRSIPTGRLARRGTRSLIRWAIRRASR